MIRDQSPKQQRDESRERLDAARTELRRNKFDKNRPLSQEMFSPTQSFSQSQTQSPIAAPFTQASPAKPAVNPFLKSADDRAAFLRAISRSPSLSRAQTPLTARGREREKRREREDSHPREQARTPSIDRQKEHIENRNVEPYRNSQSQSQSYITSGQRDDRSREREKYRQTDRQTDRRNYNSGADRIRSQ